MNKRIEDKIKAFVSARDWDRYHNPKDLALSVTLEASELLENFQWLSAEDAIHKNEQNIKDEIADVMIYSIMLAQKLDLDIETIILEKIRKNSEKYPSGQKHTF